MPTSTMTDQPSESSREESNHKSEKETSSGNESDAEDRGGEGAQSEAEESKAEESETEESETERSEGEDKVPGSDQRAGNGPHRSFFEPVHGAEESANPQDSKSQRPDPKGQTSHDVDPSKLPGEIPFTVWSVLKGPFDRSDVKLTGVEIDPKHGRGLARPVVKEHALIRRLNRVLGPEGWSIEFTTEGPDTCRCRLYIGSAFRDAIAEGNGGLETCIQAFRLAMRMFGIGIGLHGPPNIYVERGEDGRIANFDEIIGDLREEGSVR